MSTTKYLEKTFGGSWAYVKTSRTGEAYWRCNNGMTMRRITKVLKGDAT